MGIARIEVREVNRLNILKQDGCVRSQKELGGTACAQSVRIGHESGRWEQVPAAQLGSPPVPSPPIRRAARDGKPVKPVSWYMVEEKREPFQRRPFYGVEFKLV